MLRRAALVFVLGSWLAACSPAAPAHPASPPQPRGEIRLAFPGNPDVKDVPLLMALDSLRAEGYQTEIVSLARYDLLPDSLARGDADLGSVSPQSGWSAIAAGADLRSVVTQFGPLWSFVVRQEIKSCDDLDGRAVGYNNVRGVNQVLFETYLAEHCPNVSVKVVLLEQSANRVAALQAHQIDATMLELEDRAELERQAPGKFRDMFSYADEFPLAQFATVAVGQAWTAQHPERVRDFIRALLLTHRQIAADPQRLAGEIAARLSVDQAAAPALADLYLKAHVWDVNGGLTLDSVRFTLELLTQVEAVPAGLRPEDVADLSHLNAVLDEIGRQ